MIIKISPFKEQFDNSYMHCHNLYTGGAATVD